MSPSRRLAAAVLVVALVVGACANPVDKRRAEELGADPILIAPEEGWNLTISTQFPGGVSAINGQPSWTSATNTWDVEGEAGELLPLLADHAEASGWTVVSAFCGSFPRSGSLSAARIVDGDVASAKVIVRPQDSLVVTVQIGLEMPPIDQEGIQRGADVSPPLDRAGTCLDPDFAG